MVNVYSDSLQTTLKYLKDTEANINNVLMIENFNISNSSWDLLFLYYFIHSSLLINIIDSMNLYISKATNQVLTRYIDNQEDSNLTIDLIFLCPNSLELGNHMIYLK